MMKFSKLFNQLKGLFAKKKDSNIEINKEKDDLNISHQLSSAQKEINDTLVPTGKTVGTFLDENIKKIVKVNIVEGGGIYGNVIPAVVEIDQVSIEELEKLKVILLYSGRSDNGVTILNSIIVPVLPGKYTVSAISDNEDYILTGKIKAEFIITKASAKVQVPIIIDNLKYNGRIQDLIMPGKSLNGKFWYKLEEGEWGESVPTVKNAGIYTVYYKFIADDNYEYTDDIQKLEISIAKSPVTIVTEDQKIEYGEKEPEYTFKIVSGEIFSGDFLNVLFEREKGEHAGNYEITIEPQEEKNPNYEIICKPGVLTISRRKTKLKVWDWGNKVYDGNPVNKPLYSTNSTAEPLVEYMINGEYCKKAPVNAGIYGVRIVVPENRDCTEFVKEQEVTIKKASAEIKLPEIISNLKYNGSVQELIIPGNSEQGIFWYKLEEGKWGESVPAVKNAGVYTVYYKFVADNNYEYTDDVKKLEISIIKNSVTIVAEDQKIEYGGKEPKYTFKIVSGEIFSGDSLNVLFKRGKGEHAGNYAIIIEPQEEKNPNYEIICKYGILTISRRKTKLKVWDWGNKIYDGNPVNKPLYSTNSTAEPLVEYLINEEYCKKAPVNAGIYRVRIVVPENRDCTKLVKEQELIIKKALAEVKLPEIIRNLRYNGRIQNLIIPGSSSEGTFWYKLGEGEWGKTIPAVKDAGIYTVYYKFIADDNYEGADSIQKLEISVARRPITIVAEDKTIIYGEKEPEYTFKVMAGSIFWGDSLKVSFEREQGNHVGNYEITVSSQSNNNPNYEILCRSGNLTISQQKSIIEILDCGNKIYDGRPANGQRYINTSDAPTEIYYWIDDQYSIKAPVDVGEYPMEFRGLESRDYTGVVEKRTLVIKKAMPEIKWPKHIKNLVYSGKEQKLLIPGNSENGKFIYKLAEKEWSIELPEAIDAGEYHVFCKFIPDRNHEEISEKKYEDITVTILKKKLMVRIVPNGGIYDGKIIPAYGELLEEIAGKMPEIIIKYVGKSNSGIEIDQIETPSYAGNYTIQAVIDNPNYEAEIEENLIEYIIKRADPELHIGELKDNYVVGSEFKLNVTYRGDGEIVYISSNETVGVVDKAGIVKITGYGKTIIKVILKESSNYIAAEREVYINVISHHIENTNEKVDNTELTVYTRSELEKKYEDTVHLITGSVNKMYLKLLQVIEDKNIYTHLRNRIVSEFKDVKLLCEISVNDEEYDILCSYLRKWYQSGIQEGCSDIIDIIFCVALTQIGIRCYDGSYWNHVEAVIGKGQKCNITISQRDWMGRVFAETMLGFGKAIYKRGENIANILMHCFVTDNFAPRFFEFLFQYYDYDLERDISGNVLEESLNVCNSIKNPYGKRKQFLSNYIYLSVRCDVEYCQRIIAEILTLIDKRFWKDDIETYKKCRLVEKFLQWSEEIFFTEQQRYYISKEQKSHVKKYRVPYMKCDMENAYFQIVFPSQIIVDGEERILVEWRIMSKEQQVFSCDVQEGICGLKTELMKIDIKPQEIFEAFEFRLFVNNNELRKFIWKKQNIIFFNKDGDWIKGENLKVGLYYAFALNDILDCKSILDKRNRRGLYFYELKLEMGDMLLINGENGYYIAESYQEGLAKDKKLSGMYAEKDGEKIGVYHQMPAVIIKVEQRKFNGTAIIINGIISKLSENNFVSILGEQVNSNYYYIELESLAGIRNGLNYIKIDLPASHRKLEYEIVLIQGFNYSFGDELYVYKKYGIIRMNRIIENNLIKADSVADIQNYHFDVEGLDMDYLKLEMDINNQILDVYFQVPILQYSWDRTAWITEAAVDIWHSELNDFLYLRYPRNKIALGVANNDESFFEYYKNKEGIFECDLTKIKTYLNRNQILQQVVLRDGNGECTIARIIMKSYLNRLRLEADYEKNIIIGTLDMVGKGSYYIDIICDNVYLAEKMPIMLEGFEFSADIHSTEYTVRVFEGVDNDFGFDDDYEYIGESTQKIFAPRDLTNNYVKVSYIQKKDMRLKLQYEYLIFIETQKRLHQYQGRLIEKFRDNITYIVPVVLVIPDLNDITQLKVYIENKKDDGIYFQYNETKNYIINPKYYLKKSEYISKYNLDDQCLWKVQYLDKVDKNLEEKISCIENEKKENRVRVNVGSNNYYWK